MLVQPGASRVRCKNGIAMFACHLDMVFLFLLVPRRPLVLLCVRYVGQNAPKC